MADIDKYTVGWISNIRLEYVAATAFLDRIENLEPVNNLEYTCGKIGNHNVVIACIPTGELGVAGSAIVATNLKNIFRNIKFILMVGIAGGAPSLVHDIRLGDVVVGSRGSSGKPGGVFQYDKGKSIQNQPFYSTGRVKEPPAFLQLAVDRLKDRYERDGHQLQESIEEVLTRFPKLRQRYQKQSDDDFLFRSDIIHDDNSQNSNCSWCPADPTNLILRLRRDENTDDPSVHHGIIASASQVVKDGHLRDKLASQKDVLCFDIGSAGVMGYLPCLVIRGICDYSDSHPRRLWYGYAAMTSTAYAKDLLSCIPQQDFELKGSNATTLLQSSGVASTGISRKFHDRPPTEKPFRERVRASL
nr:WD repeat-containing protein [Colletotrichum truncatum]KAF6781844.1 WD repeat-containing protein [Colletotrichum truncatum]